MQVSKPFYKILQFDGSSLDLPPALLRVFDLGLVFTLIGSHHAVRVCAPNKGWLFRSRRYSVAAGKLWTSNVERRQRGGNRKERMDEGGGEGDKKKRERSWLRMGFHIHIYKNNKYQGGYRHEPLWVKLVLEPQLKCARAFVHVVSVDLTGHWTFCFSFLMANQKSAATGQPVVGMCCDTTIMNKTAPHTSAGAFVSKVENKYKRSPEVKRSDLSTPSPRQNTLVSILLHHSLFHPTFSSASSFHALRPTTTPTNPLIFLQLVFSSWPSRFCPV